MSRNRIAYTGFLRVLAATALCCGGINRAAADFVRDTNVSFGSSPALVKITIVDAGNNLDVTLQLQTAVGDLRGFFFNVVNPLLLNDMTVTGADVSGHAFANNGVTDLGMGANIHPAGPFDGGVRLGTPGAGHDVIHETSFTISSSGAQSAITNLDISDLLTPTSGDNLNLIFGVRVTSLVNGGSAKIGYGAPEPASLVTWATVASFGVYFLKRRRQPIRRNG